MKNKIRRLSFLLGICVSFTFINSDAQDSLQITLPQAETQFLQRNFLLLAAKYRINEADAAIIQARLYPNPNLSINQGVYNQDTKKWLDLSSTGETAVSLQQVILLAGKRNKQVDLAKINSQISTYQFYDLVRTLRYELRSTFYDLYFLDEPLAVYDKEIESLKMLIDTYTDQYKKGNVAFKDLARLQAEQFSLQNERLDLLKQITDKQTDLGLLIGDTLARQIKPVADKDFLDHIDMLNLSYEQLLDSAFANRYDLKAANTQVQLNQSNLALQKSLRVPDLTVGANYDKAGSYVRNFNAISLAIDLPFWNRNQGNIKEAQSQIEESKQLQSNTELQVKVDISKAYHEILETDKLYKTISVQFTADYEKLLDGIIKGYENHTISLLEFIDYYETYKNSKLEYNRLETNRLDALENLNLATGTIILK
ncbi:MAG TPA: TolC family protein [Chitinophagaceae bacterium]